MEWHKLPCYVLLVAQVAHLKYSICISSMGASLDFRAPRNFPFKITRLEARRIHLVEPLVVLTLIIDNRPNIV